MQTRTNQRTNKRIRNPSNPRNPSKPLRAHGLAVLGDSSSRQEEQYPAEPASDKAGRGNRAIPEPARPRPSPRLRARHRPLAETPLQLHLARRKWLNNQTALNTPRISLQRDSRKKRS